MRYIKTKRRRSDSVLWQKPLHPRKCQKGKVKTQTTPQKSSIKQRLRTDLGRSVGVTTATQLVWLTWFTGPTFPLPATAVQSKGHTFKGKSKSIQFNKVIIKIERCPCSTTLYLKVNAKTQGNVLRLASVMLDGMLWTGRRVHRLILCQKF